MIKAVYRKIFLNKIWLQCIFVGVVSLFLYKYVCALNVSEETEELFTFTLLAVSGLAFILVFCHLLSGVSQAARLGKWLKQLSPMIRERLEYDFQTGDQIGDLYFTNSHLFVFQLRGGMHNGIICIPYEEISEVRIKPGAARNTFLEICRTQNQPSHYVFYQSGVTNEMVQTINDKLDALRNRMEPLMPKTEEQKKAEKKEQRSAERNKLVDTGIFFLALDFVVLMIFCAVIGWAEDSWKQIRAAEQTTISWLATVPLSAQDKGQLLFWPSLIFYLVMYGGSLLLVIGIILFMRKRIYKKADETIEWKCRWQIAGFTVLAVLFILFMGLMYSTDVGTWERLTEGYQLLKGVM